MGFGKFLVCMAAGTAAVVAAPIILPAVAVTGTVGLAASAASAVAAASAMKKKCNKK